MANDTSKNEELQLNSYVNEVKDVILLIKEKKYFQAFKAFLKLFVTFYKMYIKGKYIRVKGKKIPLVAVLVLVLFIGWAAIPSGTVSEDQQDKSVEDAAQEQSLKEKEDLNTYNQDGVKVYGMYKCEQAVCGFLENSSDNDVARILISVTFHDKTGAVIYEGGAEATAMTAKSRSRFKIAPDGDFDYFRLTDVTVEK